MSHIVIEKDTVYIREMKKWIEIENKYIFLEKHFKKGLECEIDFYGNLEKHNKIWINEKNFIQIDVLDSIIELKTEKKNSLVLFYILDLLKLKDYGGYQESNYEIEINDRIKMKIDKTDKIEEFIKNITNETKIISIKVRKEDDDIECVITFGWTYDKTNI